MSLLLRVILEYNDKLKIEEIKKKVLQKFEAYSEVPSLMIDKYPTKTFSNDIKALKDAWKIQINVDKHYRYSVNKDFEDNGIFQNDLINSAIFLASLNSDMMLPGYVIPETRKNTGFKYFHLISEAIQAERSIKISYFDYITEQEKSKEIQPYKIKQKDFKWYVLATDGSDVPFKSYALERIKKIEVLGKFPQKEIDFETPYQDVIGMFTDGEVQEIIVEYDHRDGHYLKANPIHHSQKVISETTDRIQFRFFIMPNNDFLMELLKRSWSLKVIKPDSLRKRMMGFWRDAMERNK